MLSAAWEPIDAGLSALHEGGGGFGAGRSATARCSPAGWPSGCSALVGYERWMRRRATAAATAVGPGAMAVARASRPARPCWRRWSPARRLALLIAVGIGLHNFAEGLAIGQSAASGEIALATMLVIGFGLHNATEGFGIVAPLAGRREDGGPRRAGGSCSACSA